MEVYPDIKVYGANMGPIWGQQNPVGPHVGPMNFFIWAGSTTQVSDGAPMVKVSGHKDEHIFDLPFSNDTLVPVVFIWVIELITENGHD